MYATVLYAPRDVRFAPVRRYLADLMDRGYRAMDERRATKTLLIPNGD